MKVNDYFLSCGLAAAVSLILIFLLWLFSLISWGIVWAVLAFGLVPVMSKAIQFYRDNNCMDITDFFSELKDYVEEKKESESKSNIEW